MKLLPPQKSPGAHRFVRRRGSHIFLDIRSQIAVRLSVLCAGRPTSISRKISSIHLYQRLSQPQVFLVTARERTARTHFIRAEVRKSINFCV
jgi:hypothetical protein